MRIYFVLSIQIKDESIYETLTDQEYLNRMMKNKDVVDFVVGDDPEEGVYCLCVQC